MLQSQVLQSPSSPTMGDLLFVSFCPFFSFVEYALDSALKAESRRDSAGDLALLIRLS